MAAKGTFPIKVDNNLRGFAIVLKSAACEWLLLFLLLLDAAFSYLLTKFAQYCNLQLPCILCSRLDHVLGNEKPDFYKNLLCSDHRSEISSLVVCQNHGKIADAHEMCEQCVLSFVKESNQEMYKVFVGKLGSDCLQKPFVSLDSVPGSLSTRLCSCCAKPWRSRPNVHKLVQSRSFNNTSKPDIPLPKSPGRRCLNRQEGLKKRKDRFSMSTTPILLGRTGYDSLSHVGYTEVKITSDSESDFPFSDDDDMTSMPPDQRNVKDEYISQQGFKLLPKSQYDDFSPAGLIHKSNHSMGNFMNQEQELEPEKGETTTPTYMVSNGDVRHSFCETNWQQIRNKTSHVLSEFTSLEDIPLSTSVPEISPVVSPDEDDRVPLSEKFGASGLSDVFHNNTSPSKSMQLPVRISKEKWIDGKENGDIGDTSATNNWESIDLNGTTTLKDIGIDPVRKDAVSLPKSSSPTDAEGLVPSIRNDVKLSQQLGRRDFNGIGSNEEPTTSKTSLAPLADPSLCIKNRTVNGHVDGLHMADALSSIESRMPSPRTERTRYPESLKGNAGEIEGENLVDKLREQVEYNKKCVDNLYKELEEERSAAAIAANQAMAMITKLQEEKAALHMEALQYLRMMEEQAGYDNEELEKANDLLAEKEKEIQDLEAELDYFRIKYPEDFPEYSELLGEGLDLEDTLTSNMESINFEDS